MSSSIQTVSRGIEPGVGGRIRWTLAVAIVVVLLAGMFLIGRLTAHGTTVYEVPAVNARIGQIYSGQALQGVAKHAQVHLQRTHLAQVCWLASDQHQLKC